MDIKVLKNLYTFVQKPIGNGCNGCAFEWMGKKCDNGIHCFKMNAFQIVSGIFVKKDEQ